MAASLLLWPHFPPTHDLIADAWLHAVYFTVFLYGWWMGTDAGWWDELKRLRPDMTYVRTHARHVESWSEDPQRYQAALHGFLQKVLAATP